MPRAAARVHAQTKVFRKIALSCPLLLCAAALAPALANADFVIDGRGFGHGIGMPQYGAYGYALKTRHTDAYILAHYYPGTRLGETPGRVVRVLLKQGPALLVAEGTQLVAPGRAPISLHPDRTYRFEPDGAGLRVVDATVGRTKARVTSPARVTGDGMVRLRGLAQNGVMSGHYRSEMWLSSDGASVTAINRLGLQRYLYGVVPAEMPSRWPLEARKAQAVVARSYALRSLRPAAAFDVYADTRSQMYKGVSAETASTTTAVRATDGDTLFYGGAIAATYFHSSSGGKTASVADEWGGSSVPYLQPVDDPYDYLSPYHRWSVTLTTAEAQARLGPLVAGQLVTMRVTARNSSGRVAAVEVTGTAGITTATGVQVRTALRLRSTAFEVHPKSS
jgi:SpoIID/LytB domain protein